MNPTALQILRAALERIAASGDGDVARAALEAAAKAPGIDREQLFKWIVANDHRAGDLRQRAIDDVLDAVDAYQRGGAKQAIPEQRNCACGEWNCEPCNWTAGRPREFWHLHGGVKP